jgi:hypothetical protein
MSAKRMTETLSICFILAVILSASACGPGQAEPTQTPLLTSTESFTPTFTLTPTSAPTFTIVPTSTSTFTITPTSTTIPTDSPTPRPTSVPGTKFNLTIEGVKLQLEVPNCQFLSLTLGYGQPEIVPLPSDDVLCVMMGDIIEGKPTDEQVDNWVKSGQVYLLDQAGHKAPLIHAFSNLDKRKIMWIFSAPSGYAPIQLQVIDQLIELP